jgi:hypothetical protein
MMSTVKHQHPSINSLPFPPSEQFGDGIAKAGQQVNTRIDKVYDKLSARKPCAENGRETGRSFVLQHWEMRIENLEFEIPEAGG